MPPLCFPNPPPVATVATAIAEAAADVTGNTTAVAVADPAGNATTVADAAIFVIATAAASTTYIARGGNGG